MFAAEIQSSTDCLYFGMQVNIPDLYTNMIIYINALVLDLYMRFKIWAEK